jgi:hypothetical protein
MVANAVIAGATALIPGGRSAAISLSKQIMTKFERKEISSLTAKTAARVTAGQAQDSLARTVIGGEVAGAKDALVSPQTTPKTKSCVTQGTMTSGCQ